MRPTVIGEVGRLLVSAELLKAGFIVSRPEVDVGYDLISTCPDGVSWKLQVKTSSESSRFSLRRMRYSGKQATAFPGQKAHYTRRDVDAFAFVLLAGPEFWLMPASETSLSSHWVTMRPGTTWHRNWGALRSAP